MAAYDTVFRGALVHYGTAAPPRLADVAISGERIADIAETGRVGDRHGVSEADRPEVRRPVDDGRRLTGLHENIRQDVAVDHLARCVHRAQ